MSELALPTFLDRPRAITLKIIMDIKLEALFEEAENRYLATQELGVLSQYVESLPLRLETYRTLRDQELSIMQAVADQLQAEMPQAKTVDLERSIRNGLLCLRYVAIAMLLNDESYLKKQLDEWITKTIKVYNTQQIDAALYRLLGNRLAQTLTPNQMTLVQPMLNTAQNAILNPSATPVGMV